MSSSNQNHGPVFGVGDVEHAGVPGLLPLDRPPHDLNQLLVGAVGGPEAVLEVDLGRAEEADFEVAVGCQPDAIAGAAKVLAHRGDETHSPCKQKSVALA